MAFRHGQFNFSKGVLTEELWGRVDIAPYNAAVKQGINVVILKYGGLRKRPGTRFVYEITGDVDVPHRMIPFEGAFEASYALLFGQANMRLAALGGMVIEELLTVQAIYLENPTRIKADYHGYEDGDEVFFDGLEGTTELNGLIYPVTVVDDNHFTIPVDGATLSALTGDSGGIIRSGPPDSPPPPPTVPPEEEEPELPPIGGGGGHGFEPVNPSRPDDRHIP